MGLVAARERAKRPSGASIFESIAPPPTEKSKKCNTKHSYKSTNTFLALFSLLRNRVLLALAGGFRHRLKKFGNHDFCAGGPLCWAEFCKRTAGLASLLDPPYKNIHIVPM